MICSTARYCVDCDRRGAPAFVAALEPARGGHDSGGSIPHAIKWEMLSQTGSRTFSDAPCDHLGLHV